MNSTREKDRVSCTPSGLGVPKKRWSPTAEFESWPYRQPLGEASATPSKERPLASQVGDGFQYFFYGFHHMFTVYIIFFFRFGGGGLQGPEVKTSDLVFFCSTRVLRVGRWVLGHARL